VCAPHAACVRMVLKRSLTRPSWCECACYR
jgi:hypothetical protein